MVKIHRLFKGNHEEEGIDFSRTATVGLKIQITITIKRKTKSPNGT